MELLIHNINRGAVAAKIVEFYRAVKELYTMDEIMSMSLLEEVAFETGDVQLGAVSSNELDLTLSNDDDKFTPGNTQSIIQSYLKKNRYVRPYIGYVEGENTYWFGLGGFWTVHWKVPTDGTVSLTARDRLELLRDSDFETSIVYVNKSLGELFEIVLLDAGVESYEFVIAPSLYSIIVPYAWFNKMSHRSALQRLAENGIIHVYVDRIERIIVSDNTPTATSTITFDDNVNVLDKVFPSKLANIINYVEVNAQTFKVSEAQELFKLDTSVLLAPEESITLQCAFTKTPALAISETILVGGADLIVTGIELFCWSANVTIQNIGVADLTLTNVTINGTILEASSQTTKIAKDDYSIVSDGKVRATVTKDFIQNPVYAQSLANQLLAQHLAGKQNAELVTYGDITILLGDRVTITDANTNISEEYMLVRQDIQFDGDLRINISTQHL